jgi:hypothetical protein
VSVGEPLVGVEALELAHSALGEDPIFDQLARGDQAFHEEILLEPYGIIVDVALHRAHRKQRKAAQHQRQTKGEPHLH